VRAVAAFPGRKTLEIVSHPEPQLTTPTQARVRILDVGICGTDKEIARFDYGVPPDGSQYLVMGHESLGEVIEVGPGCTKVGVGDLVVTTVRRPCGHPNCVACQQGRQDFCYTGDFTERGIKGAHGFMTERIVDDERYMNVLPRELRDVGVLVEPLTIAEKALAQVWDVQERLPWACREAVEANPSDGLRALVLGAGPVGLLGAMALTQAGFDTWVYSREPAGSDRSMLVESFGGRYISGETCAAADIPKVMGPIDMVYEAVGASTLAFQVLSILGPNAVFVFTGVPGRKGPIEVDTDQFMRNMVLKNQLVFGTVNAGREAFEASIRDLTLFKQRWPDAVSAMITGRFAMDDYGALLTGTQGGIKNVMAIG
jgi:threonine dehydrogenase-like Zn-dependent dehydrogenase